MIQEFSAYPDWKAPAEDSAVVVWPEPAKILSDTVENHARLSAWSSPLGELRRKQREALRLGGPAVIEVRVDASVCPPLGERAKSLAGFIDK